MLIPPSYLFYLTNCILFILFVSVSPESKKCHSLYSDSKYYLGTKTPYSYVANVDDDPIVYGDCTPIRIWALVRHGTRNPGKISEKMRVNLSALKMILMDRHEAGKGNLCREEVEELRKWKPTVDPSELKFLTHEGEEEMLLLGERFLNRFPDLLPESYSNRTYKFRHTATQRTRESSQYFTVGLFGRRQKAHVWYPEPLAKDPILRFYKLCKRWRTEVDKNADALTELDKFKATPLVSRMLDNISARIGLSDRISFEDAKLIYQTCAFETAWHPKSPSPWCALFSKDDLEILEYSEDLKYYWIDGYGYPITYKQACVAVNDMFHHLTDESHPPYTFYFTHSGTILKVLSHLQLYRDPLPLSADLFNKTRLWRTSQIDVFGSNLAFVLFSCKDGYKILTMHQERPVTLPGCPEDHLCPLDSLQDFYRHSIENCDFDQFCHLDT
ncbi:multiple inositol polyphosphate phosphatase 1-like [Homalodisca vitripennis]|uniref:multiple inositol polyphosphate phosphatase 1-like n=1 Tax=Homalodisca vitripennis TaxID=197043 RepID=UPI001EEA696E|nr:multiple inositol polyphosphate phosphatase 1-like [Homalodisca vitripennis]